MATSCRPRQGVGPDPVRPTSLRRPLTCGNAEQGPSSLSASARHVLDGRHPLDREVIPMTATDCRTSPALAYTPPGLS